MFVNFRDPEEQTFIFMQNVNLFTSQFYFLLIKDSYYQDLIYFVRMTGGPDVIPHISLISQIPFTA